MSVQIGFFMWYYLSKYSLSLAILLSIIIGAVGAKFVSLDMVRASYSISVIIKDAIMVFLPIVIFSYISFALTHGQNVGIKIMLTLIIAICISNFCSTMVAYLVNTLVISHVQVAPQLLTSTEEVVTKLDALSLAMPKLLSNEISLVIGIVSGIVANTIRIKFLRRIINAGHIFSMFYLNRIVVPLVPFFVLGFIAKLSYEGLFIELLEKNWIYLMTIISTVVLYLTFLLYVSAKISKKSRMTILNNIGTAIITAFSTMSSTATLPLSLKAAEKNVSNKSFAGIYIPTSVNIHLIGDSIILPMLAMMLMHYLNNYSPSLSQYLVFSGYFIMAKFAIATVPGGGIFVMIPVLEKVFGFSNEMSGIITTFYLLLDPLLAAANVTGNNLFCIILDRLLFIKKPRRMT